MELSQLIANRLVTFFARQEVGAHFVGAVSASVLLYVLFHAYAKIGVPVVPSLHPVRFSVAMLSGHKQAAQQAPKNAEHKAEVVKAAPVEVPDVPVVTAERETSLPNAVAAAQDSAPGPEIVKKDEVIPPATVSMPGGKLMVVDSKVGGSEPDPFAVGPKQVYLRLFVNLAGQVIRGGIVRHGPEPMRDALILKAMQSRTFQTEHLLRVEGGAPMWQMDLVIDYGTNEFLP